jgi:iron(III) transport system permease protein
VLPLAVPSYLMAYVYLSLGGNYGLLARGVGISIPRPSGYWGAWLILTLATSPYMFLNLRSAFLHFDHSLEEAARSLGASRWERWCHVYWPQLLPAIGAGSLLVGLHVLGNFSVVSLMRYDTFSAVIYRNYNSSISAWYIAWLALTLLVLTAIAVFLEARVLHRVSQERAGVGVVRKEAQPELGRWTLPATLYLGLHVVLSLLIPLAVIVWGMWQGNNFSAELPRLWKAVKHTLSSSIPVALLAPMLTLPFLYLSLRFPSRISRLLERISYFGYAIPSLAFALGWVYFCLKTARFAYQSLGLLVLVLSLHFMAEALGPIRSALYKAPYRLEEAARSLGCSPWRAFWSVTLPILRKGVALSCILVFLSTIKELPISVLVSPPGYTSLSMGAWSAIEEAEYAQAAPYSLCILLCSAIFVTLLLRKESS